MWVVRYLRASLQLNWLHSGQRLKREVSWQLLSDVLWQVVAKVLKSHAWDQYVLDILLRAHKFCAKFHHLRHLFVRDQLLANHCWSLIFRESVASSDLRN